MNTHLFSYLSAHAQEDVLFVLWGFAPEDAGLERPSLDALLQQRLSRYLSGLLSRSPSVVTAEEFALHADLLTQEFPQIILVQDSVYRAMLPVSVTLSPEVEAGLLSHFDPAVPVDTSLPAVEPYLQVYSNLLRTEQGLACCIPLDSLLCRYPQIQSVQLGAAPQPVPEASAPADCFTLTNESDYFCLVQRLCSGETLCVSADGFEGGEASLAASLSGLNGAFPGQLFRAHAHTAPAQRSVCPEARQLLQQHWGYPDFLPLEVYDLAALYRGEKKLRTISQEDIIDDLIRQAEICREGGNYRDLFFTASTGAGKSVMFQIPAIDLAEKYDLVTLVISPLIGLMNDQVQGMEKHHYAKARTINSDIPPMVKKTIAQEVQQGKCDILYLSPESLLSHSDISALIGDRAIGLLIVDEAHIVTTWGKQFRPDYWFLGDYVNKLRKRQLNGPHHHAFVTATFTATATYGGEEDMYRETLRSLHMSPDPIVYLGCVRRRNIELCIREVPRVSGRREYELDKFQSMTAQITAALEQGQKTLVYFPTVGLLERFYTHCLAQYLGSAVTRYHARLSGEDKAENLADFRSGKCLVMLATKAFGMGIDIPDIALVLHFAPTGNLCDYTQEIGRAARNPAIQGRAVYEHMANDFKHINRLHGLSSIQPWQLVQVMRKVLQLYRQHLNDPSSAGTKRRNELLVDAESFAYIFQNPNGGDRQDPLAKVKTAMLLIQKDSEARGYAPFVMRPSPLFTHGYFQFSPADAAALEQLCPDCAVPEEDDVCDIDLGRLWASCYKDDFSFPQFKYLLYSHSDTLPLNARCRLQPAMQLTLEWTVGADARFSVLLRALQAVFFAAARSGHYLYDRDAAAQLAQTCGISRTRAASTVRVVLAAVQSWQQNTPRLQRSRVLRRGTTQEGVEYSTVDPFISEFFHWLEQSYTALRSGKACRYLPADNSAQGSERLTPALGVLEELDLLHFALLGGSNSRLYLYINQTQTLELADRGFYRNRLLERIAQRHTDAVRLMSWLFTGGFTSEQLWDRIEAYFLGLPIEGFGTASAEPG